MIQPQCLVRIFELKKMAQYTMKSNNEQTQVQTVSRNEPTDKIVLNIYLKTTSIAVNVEGSNQSNEYFINSDNKLCKYDLNGQNSQLVTGNFLIIISNDSNLVNKAFKVTNGLMENISTYFDGSRLKLIIDNQECNHEGTLILTDDHKIFVRIGNGWFGK